MPTRSQHNCVSVRHFRIYNKTGTGDYRLLKSVYVTQFRLDGINQYRNVTIGISLVNNAGLESVKTDHIFVGSEWSLLLC